MTLQSNILVISDLHLGEDLSATATPATTKNLEVLDRQLIAFLRHYATRRQSGRPWRLVINGDMVDFLTIFVRPDDCGLDFEGHEFTPDEHVYGLGRRPRAAAAKMVAVVERHRDVFRAMARFVATGNSIEIVCGNHDAEFHFPQVQQALRDGVARLYSELPGANRSGAPTPQMIGERIRFHRWFFYEPGVAWIEHGHQYDECSSFDFQLAPVAATGAIARNVDEAGLRYVANHTDAEQHSLAEWDFVGYVKFGLSLGARGVYKLFKNYLTFVFSLLAVWKSYRPWSKANRNRGDVHAARLRALGKSFELDERSLRAVDDLRRRPVVGNLSRLLSVLMVDRLVISVLGIVGVIVALAALPWLWGIPTAVALFVLSRIAAHHTSRKRMVDPVLTLGMVPERICKHVDAKFVVFGHTHNPVAQQLEGGRWYYNTGTWVPTSQTGLLRAFTHLIVLNGERGASARLCQWRDGASRAFTPGFSKLPVAIEPEPVVEPVVEPIGDLAPESAPVLALG